ncbi:MAG: ABC transporter permease [Ruminococcaceae bacterium]|nr:ABC transporter permease [Oscillospiraceae bacterium]
MKNPLNKRYKKELKSDAGKYIAIFLFLVFFIGAMSGFFVADNSVVSNYEESHIKYNIEDGHLAFNIKPDKAVISEIETQNGLKLFPLYYKEEKVKNLDDTLRIYADRDTVNTECVLDGKMPEAANEIALDRMYADNNELKVGSVITVRDTDYTVSALIAVPDYSCLFESNSDMMFDALSFGVAVVSGDGFSKLPDAHLTYNYAFRYDKAIADDTDANTRSEALIDSLENIVKKYDEPLLQAQVNSVYKEAKSTIKELESEFETASDELETKIRAAMRKAGALNTAGIANELGTTEDKYNAMMNAFEEAEGMEEDFDFDSLDKAPKVSLDDYESEAGFDSKLDEAMNTVYNIVDAVEATGIYDCSTIRKNLGKLDRMMDIDIDDSGILTIEDYNPRYTNKAITFVMEDSTSDKASATMMLYIIIAVIAFVFAVTTSNTISKEANVIGTLRASGYSRGELIRHYMFLPVTVTLLAALVGNILGYTVFQRMFVGVYYGNYSLTEYKVLWNSDAFIRTTVVPLVLMFVINFIVLSRKLKISPLNFLRGELKKKSRKSVIRLPKKLPFFSKFRLRILFENIPSYLTLFVGVILAGMLVVFGTMFEPLVQDYTALVDETKLANYQYILSDESETENKDAEKYCVTSLETMYNKYLTDDVMIYGINSGSKYVKAEIPSGKVLASNGLLDKFGLKSGDTINLKEPYGNKVYTFTIAGEYRYDAAISVFMSRSDYLKVFNKDDDYFTGYFSNEELTDIGEDSIAAVITEADLIKMVTQLESSMLDFMVVFKALGIVIFLLLMYILTKQIIEKNTKSIAMAKILGFTNIEIGRLYLIMTSFAVLVSLLLSIPLIDAVLRWAFHSYLYTEMTGYIPYIVSKSCFVTMVILGMVCYGVVAAGLMLKIKKTPKGEALKNQSL